MLLIVGAKVAHVGIRLFKVHVALRVAVELRISVALVTAPSSISPPTLSQPMACCGKVHRRQCYTMSVKGDSQRASTSHGF